MEGLFQSWTWKAKHLKLSLGITKTLVWSSQLLFSCQPPGNQRMIVSLTRHLISASRDPQEDPSFLRNQSGNGKNWAREDHVILVLIPGKSWRLSIQVYKPLPLECCWNHIHKLRYTVQGTRPSSPGLYNSWSRSLEEKRKGWLKKKHSTCC